MIVGGVNTKKWTDREAVVAVRNNKKLKKAYEELRRLPPKKNPPRGKPPRSSGSREPRKPKPSSGSGSAAKRNRRKKQFENKDEYYSASHGHRPRGRPTPCLWEM